MSEKSELHLQRLNYPSRGELIRQVDFGPSTFKYKYLQFFFGCAVMHHPSFGNGVVQKTLDEFYEQRQQVGQREIELCFDFAKATGANSDAGFIYHRSLFALGPIDKLDGFQDLLLNASQEYQNGGSVLLSGLRESFLIECLSSPETRAAAMKVEQFAQRLIPLSQKDVMGWLDLNSGCFAMRSLTSLNRVRELFGIRPHVPQRTQNDNYPSVDVG